MEMKRRLDSKFPRIKLERRKKQVNGREVVQGIKLISKKFFPLKNE